MALTVLAGLEGAPPAIAASLPVGGGYGKIDAVRDIDAVGLGHQFCAARLLDDMARVVPYFAPKLSALLEGTPAAAVPWQSYPVRPTGCEITVVNGFTTTIGVMLAVDYTAPGLAWQDVLSLQRTPDSWRINNIFYEGGGNLRFRLFALH